MKSYCYLLLTVLFISCGKGKYTLDYRNIDVPEHPMIIGTNTDSVVRLEDSFYESMKSCNVFVTTDKMSYKQGEAVVLKIENKSNNTEYYYRADSDPGYNSLFEPDKETIERSLVSKNPAIGGGIMHQHSNYYYIIINSFPASFMSKHGFVACKLEVKPQKSILFKVRLPNAKGTFRFVLQRFTHRDKSDSAWGGNRMVFSNSFTIQ